MIAFLWSIRLLVMSSYCSVICLQKVEDCILAKHDLLAYCEWIFSFNIKLHLTLFDSTNLIFSLHIVNVASHFTGVARRGVSSICKWPWICFIIRCCRFYHVRIQEARIDGTIYNSLLAKKNPSLQSL